jgi:thioredoxin reductase (NADPH)
VYDTVVKSINGKNGVEGITLINKKTDKETSLQCGGVFIFVGWDLNTDYLPAAVINDKGEVIVDNQASTPVPGLFAAGDIREASRRQIVMACADGATAALSAYDFIAGLR